jgi:energy-coupling factor transport system ATP-binding protein
MEEAALADRVVVLDKGKIVIDDVPKAVFSKVEKIKAIGLDVPQVTELVHELAKEGIELADDIITVEECADAIVELLKKQTSILSEERLLK